MKKRWVMYVERRNKSNLPKISETNARGNYKLLYHMQLRNVVKIYLPAPEWKGTANMFMFKITRCKYRISGARQNHGKKTFFL